MVPRLGKSGGTGASFKGAGLYYLHDKKQMTQERIGETKTLNLITSDPEKAVRVMAATAMNQKQLKEDAGEKATGRKLTKPVFTYSLSWHPDDKPTASHMIEQAQDSLTALGLEGKQALIVQHCDTKHPHVHVIVNRVDPTNGIAAPLKYTKETLSRWAAAYEETHGIRCTQRQKAPVQEQEKQAAPESVPTLEPVVIDTPDHAPSNDNRPIAAPVAEEAQADALEPINEPCTAETLADTHAEAMQPAPLECEPWHDMDEQHPLEKHRSHLRRVSDIAVSMAGWLKDKTHAAYLYVTQQAAQNQQQPHMQQQQKGHSR